MRQTGRKRSIAVPTGNLLVAQVNVFRTRRLALLMRSSCWVELFGEPYYLTSAIDIYIYIINIYSELLNENRKAIQERRQPGRAIA